MQKCPRRVFSRIFNNFQQGFSALIFSINPPAHWFYAVCCKDYGKHRLFFLYLFPDRAAA